MKWFRFYHDAVNDPKVQRLSPALFKHWVNLLCLSSQNEERGTLPPLSDIAFALRLKPSEASRILSELTKEGLFDQQEDGTFCAHNWTQRQRNSDDVSTRVRRHRDAEQSQSSQSFDARREENASNVTLRETLPKRPVDIDTDIDVTNVTRDRAPNDEVLHEINGVPVRASSFQQNQEKDAAFIKRTLALFPHWQQAVDKKIAGIQIRVSRDRYTAGTFAYWLKGDGTPEPPAPPPTTRRSSLPLDHEGNPVPVFDGVTTRPLAGWICEDGFYYPKGWTPGGKVKPEPQEVELKRRQEAYDARAAELRAQTAQWPAYTRPSQDSARNGAVLS